MQFEERVEELKCKLTRASSILSPHTRGACLLYISDKAKPIAGKKWEAARGPEVLPIRDR